MTSYIIQEIKELLNTSKNIVITTHKNPDGDAIGSSLAMYLFLTKKGHNADIIVPDKYPSYLKWMPANDKILVYNDKPKKCNTLIERADVIFCLDYNSIPRVDQVAEPLKKSKGIKILIDHHVLPESNSFNHIISTVNTSSTAELIYELFVDLGEKHLIDKEIAECIYVGIITDTGSFSFACNNEKTYLVTAELIKAGIKCDNIHTLVYDTFSENSLRLLGYCLTERLKVFKEFSTAYIYLTKEDLKKFKYKIGDTENVVNYGLSIKGIKFAVFFTERKDRIRISLRSKGDFSVNEFAQKHFEGGGHKNASGGNSYISLTDTLKKFEDLLPEYSEQLNCKKS
ncbi:MAG: bifunctional oligoribonuclease/PAP phosphatase NrnA [Bacteroidales bacterium]|nr:bifunctional oligoribonuclease/PAP phosphatase NrnA [Bacteroidales bacterium]